MENFTNMSIMAVSEDNFRYSASALAIFVCMTLFGNVLVMLAPRMDSSLKSVTYSLMSSLACADMLVGGVVMPMAVYLEVTDGFFPLSDRACDFWILVDVLACTASILTMTAISLDRYLAVICAVRYKQKFKDNVWYRRLLISVPWIVALLVALPLVSGGNDALERLPNTCGLFHPIYKITSSFISFIIPAGVLTGLYIPIFSALRKRQQSALSARSNPIFHKAGISNSDRDQYTLPESVNLTNGNLAPKMSSPVCSSSRVSQQISCLSNNGQTKKNKKERRAMRTLVVVLAVFWVCWIPFFSVNIYDGIVEMINRNSTAGVIIPKADMTTYKVFVWLGYISSLANPIIYAVLNPEYRKAFKKILQCHQRRRKPVQI